MTKAFNDQFDARDPLDLVLERELARRWKRSLRTLQRWRAEGYGPAHIQIGVSIYYRIGDILAFEDLNRSGGDEA